MSELADKAKGIVLKHGKALAQELVVELAVPALEEAAKKSATPVDDMVVGALKEPLKQELLKQLEKLG